MQLCHLPPQVLLHQPHLLSAQFLLSTRAHHSLFALQDVLAPWEKERRSYKQGRIVPRSSWVSENACLFPLLRARTAQNLCGGGKEAAWLQKAEEEGRARGSGGRFSPRSYSSRKPLGCAREGSRSHDCHRKGRPCCPPPCAPITGVSSSPGGTQERLRAGSRTEQPRGTRRSIPRPAP